MSRSRLHQSQWSHSMANIDLYKSHTSAFLLSSFSRYSHFIFRDLENVGQSHDARNVQQRHTMANFNLHKSRTSAFFACCHRFFKYYISYDLQKLCDLETIGQDHDVQRSQWRHFMARFNFYKSRTLSFFASSHSFPDIMYYMILRNCVTLKISVKVIMYNNRNSAFSWPI